MRVTSLIAKLARAGIRIEALGDRLRYAPRSAATPELIEQMQVHKSELMTHLGGNGQAPAKPCRVCGCQGMWTDHYGEQHCAQCDRWSDPCLVDDYFVECHGHWLLEPHPAIVELEHLFDCKRSKYRPLAGAGFPPRPTPIVPEEIKYQPGRAIPWTRAQAEANRRATEGNTGPFSQHAVGCDHGESTTNEDD